MTLMVQPQRRRSPSYNLLKILKFTQFKSIRLLRNVHTTTTAEKFAKLQSGQVDNVRTQLFGLLDHLKRWFQHLVQRFQWFLELKHVKFPSCCASTKVNTNENILTYIFSAFKHSQGTSGHLQRVILASGRIFGQIPFGF
jgi:hypothetical protein